MMFPDRCAEMCPIEMPVCRCVLTQPNTHPDPEDHIKDAILSWKKYYCELVL